jgi:hypothetical protein
MAMLRRAKRELWDEKLASQAELGNLIKGVSHGQLI